MLIVFDDQRPSDSRFIERVWRCHSEGAGRFLSVAASHLEMVVTRHRGKTLLTLRGPETRATWADCPADREWLAIRFTLGTFMPRYPAHALMDRKDVNLPTRRSDVLAERVAMGISELRECRNIRGTARAQRRDLV
jgi:hypothetical protein